MPTPMVTRKLLWLFTIQTVVILMEAEVLHHHQGHSVRILHSPARLVMGSSQITIKMLLILKEKPSLILELAIFSLTRSTLITWLLMEQKHNLKGWEK